jgi:cytoskeleton protein RodZ
MQTDPQTDAAPKTEAAEVSGVVLSAGDVLLQARQRLGLSEKDVADRLHITMHYVKALETDNYAKLPSAVFTKGYLKSYALLLGLDSADLLSRYSEFTTQRQADIDATSRHKSRRKKDRNKPFVIMSLLFFVAGFILLWLVNSYFSDKPAAEPPITAASVGSVRPALARNNPSQSRAQSLRSVTAESEQSLSANAQTDIASIATEQIAGKIIETVGAESATAIDSLNVPEIVVPDDIEGQALLQQPIENGAQATAAELVASPRLFSIAAAGNDVLRISFSGESWVEVNDSEFQQIYRDIRTAGDVLEITGDAPFNILLGDAPFTRLSFNGAEIDLSEDIRIDNSARLTVGL